MCWFTLLQIGWRVLAAETQEELLSLLDDCLQHKAEIRLKKLVLYNLPALAQLLPDDIFENRLLGAVVALSKIDSSLGAPEDEPR